MMHLVFVPEDDSQGWVRRRSKALLIGLAKSHSGCIGDVHYAMARYRIARIARFRIRFTVVRPKKQER